MSSIILAGLLLNINNRISKLKRHFGPLKVVKSCIATYSQAAALEMKMHKHFKKYCKVQPQGQGRTEWFDNIIADEAVSMIEQFELSV